MPPAEQRDLTTAAPDGPVASGKPAIAIGSALNPPNIITLNRLLLAVCSVLDD